MYLQRALTKIEQIAQTPHLARVFLNDRDCGAYPPPVAEEMVREVERVRPTYAITVTMSRIGPSYR
jgi:hypothetical protein